MARVLIMANETIGGQPLIDKVKELQADDPDLSIVVCVPRTNPRHGNIIYDEATFQAAQVRVDLARIYLREGKFVPVSQVARLTLDSEDSVLWRRNRVPTITVRGDVTGAEAPGPRAW